MACQKCGSIIQDGLSICPVCGADLTIQSNYIKNNSEQNVQTNSNNVDNTVSEQAVISEKKRNGVLSVVIIFLSIVAILGVLIVTGTLNFGKFNDDGNEKDIKTVNEEKKTSSSTTKKTTNTTSKVENTVNGGEDVSIHGITFTIPNGFTFESAKKSDEEKIKYDYYLIRKEADALISLGFILSNISYEEVLSNVIADYEYDGGDEIYSDGEVKTYNNYNYYKIIRKEKLARGKYKEHTIILIKVDEGVYLRAYLYEPTAFGEQNYLQILTKFIDSKK